MPSRTTCCFTDAPTVQIYFEMKKRPDRSRAQICLWDTIGHSIRAINCHEGIPERMIWAAFPAGTRAMARPNGGSGGKTVSAAHDFLGTRQNASVRTVPGVNWGMSV